MNDENPKSVAEQSEVDSMCFGGALTKLKDGYSVFRLNWNGKGQWLALQKPDEHSKMTLPYIYIYTVQGDLVPWLASQTDLLSCDWMVVQVTN